MSSVADKTTPQRSSRRIKAKQQNDKSSPLSKGVIDSKKLHVPLNVGEKDEKVQSSSPRYRVGQKRPPSILKQSDEKTLRKTMKQKVNQKRPIFELSEEEKQLTESVKKMNSEEQPFPTSLQRDKKTPALSKPKRTEANTSTSLVSHSKKTNKNLPTAAEKCVCCKKPPEGGSFSICSLKGQQMNLQDLIQKFSGIDVDKGIVCGNCVQMLQNLCHQSKRFLEICKAADNSEDVSENASVKPSKKAIKKSTLKGKGSPTTCKNSPASRPKSTLTKKKPADLNNSGERDPLPLVSLNKAVEEKSNTTKDVYHKKSVGGVLKQSSVKKPSKNPSDQDEDAVFIPNFEKPVTRRSTSAASSPVKTNTVIQPSAKIQQSPLVQSSAGQLSPGCSSLAISSPATAVNKTPPRSLPVLLVTSSSKSGAAFPVKLDIRSTLPMPSSGKLVSTATSAASSPRKFGATSSTNTVTCSRNVGATSSTNTLTSPKKVGATSFTNTVTSPTTVDATSSTNTLTSPTKFGATSSTNTVTSPRNVDALSSTNPVASPRYVDATSSTNMVTSPKKVNEKSLTNVETSQRKVDAIGLTNATSLISATNVVTPGKFEGQNSVMGTTNPFPIYARSSALTKSSPVRLITPVMPENHKGTNSSLKQRQIEFDDVMTESVQQTPTILEKDNTKQPAVEATPYLRKILVTPAMNKNNNPQKQVIPTEICPEKLNPVSNMHAKTIGSSLENVSLNKEPKSKQDCVEAEVNLAKKSSKNIVLNDLITSTKGAVVVSFLGKKIEVLKVSPITSVEKDPVYDNDNVKNMISILNSSLSSNPFKPVGFASPEVETDECELGQDSRNRKKTRKSKHADHTYDVENPTKKRKPSINVNKVELIRAAKKMRYFLCSVCKTAFFNSMCLSNHWEEKHSELVKDLVMENCDSQAVLDIFKCSHCDLILDNDTDFMDHLKTAHSIEKLFSCSICEKQFEFKRQVKVHLATHFPVNTLHCSECSAEFNVRTQLERHPCWLAHAQERIQLGDKFETVKEENIDPELEDGRVFPCPMCKEIYPCTAKVIDHWNDVHGKMLDNPTETASTPSTSEGVPSTDLAEDNAVNQDTSEAISPDTYASLIGFGNMIPLCCLCNTAFDSTSSLKEHWDENHSSICIDTAQDHMELHNHKYKCKMCAAVFSCQVSVRRHLLYEHGLTKPMICVYCNKRLTTKRKMRVHMKKHFVCNFYRCSKCSKEFSTQLSLLKHSCWEGYVRRKMSITHKKPFCKKVDEKNAPVVKRCALCRVDFGSSGELKYHWEETHDQYIEPITTAVEEPIPDLPAPTLEYQCECCGQEFKQKNIYEKHRERHNITKKFKCTLCSLLLSTFRLARLHLRVHLAERPFACEKCDSKFIEKKHLEKHMIVHAGPEKRQRFICETCGRGFPSKYGLKKHRQAVHEEGGKVYNCNICRKGFLVRSKRDYHMNSHLDQRSHLCNTCGKTFKSRLNLRSHMRTHNLAKRHNCPICNRIFSHREVRGAHLLVEHKKPCHCGLVLFTIKDAIMHKSFCSGYEETLTKFNV